MTIFLEVLRTFISNLLDDVSLHLANQEVSSLHNTEASRLQREQIIKLKEKINTYVKKLKKNDDAESQDKIIGYIEKYTKKVEKVRLDNGVETEASKTLAKLATIQRRSSSFYDEISSCGFSLLNISYDKEQCAKFPRLHVYYAVANWLAQQVFEPLTMGDKEIRSLKIDLVGYRLKQLNALLMLSATEKTLTPELELKSALGTCVDLLNVDKDAKKTKSAQTSKASQESSSIVTKLANLVPDKLKLDLGFCGFSLTGNTRPWYDRLTKFIKEAQTNLEKLKSELETSTSKKTSRLPPKPQKPVSSTLFQNKLESDSSEDEDEDEEDDEQSVKSFSSS